MTGIDKVKNFKRVAAALTAIVSAVCLSFSAGAYTHQAGIFGVTDRTGIVVPDAGSVELAGNEAGADKSDYAYVMNVPGSGPGAAGIDTALEQNGSLWSNIDAVEVDFTLTNESAEDADMDYFYIQGFITLGEDADWEYLDSTNNPEIISISPAIEEGTAPEFGTKYTVTFHPADAMEDAGQSADGKGGIVNMGLKLGNDDITEMKFGIKFSDVRVTGDDATVAKYTKLASELTKGQGANEIPAPEGSTGEVTATAGAAADATTVAGAGGGSVVSDAPAPGGAKLPEGNKVGASTGAADIAIVIAIAAVAGGAVVVTRGKRK